MKWKETHDNDYYIKNFKKKVLDKLNTANVVIDLYELAGIDGTEGKDICLICYEKPEDFCHRHLVADWLSKDGFSVKEWVQRHISSFLKILKTRLLKSKKFGEAELRRQNLFHKCNFYFSRNTTRQLFDNAAQLLHRCQERGRAKRSEFFIVT